MALPASVTIAAALLGDDFGSCLRKLGALALAVLVAAVLVAAVLLSAVLALVRGGVDMLPASQLAAGGGIVRGGRPSTVTFSEIPADQLAVMQQVGAGSGTPATGGGLISGWWQMRALDQFDRRYYASDRAWRTWRSSACSAAALTWLLRAYGVQVQSIDAAIELIGPYTGISPSLGLLDARGPALAEAVARRGLRARVPRDRGGRPAALSSVAELQAWLDRGPLLMDGARWFGEGHWFVGMSYDRDGIYTRDSSGYNTQYLTWARLYGEVGFSGWVVGVA